MLGADLDLALGALGADIDLALAALGTDLDVAIGAATTAVVGAVAAAEAANAAAIAAGVVSINNSIGNQTTTLITALNTALSPLIAGVNNILTLLKRSMVLTKVGFTGSVQHSGTGLLLGTAIEFTNVFNPTLTMPVLPGQRYKVRITNSGGTLEHDFVVDPGKDTLFNGNYAVIEGIIHLGTARLTILLENP